MELKIHACDICGIPLYASDPVFRIFNMKEGEASTLNLDMCKNCTQKVVALANKKTQSPADPEDEPQTAEESKESKESGKSVQAPVKKGGRKSKYTIDAQKVKQLFVIEKKTISQISNAMGVPYSTMYTFIQQQRYESCEPSVGAEQNEDNGQGKRCPTCKYRGRLPKNGCDYIVIVGHSRGCSVENCEVYEEGDPMTYQKRAEPLLTD